MKIHIYQAECGDAIRIEYVGNDNNMHNIFIDSGYERTYKKVIEKEIQSIIEQNGSIDMWLVSHIHDDHIGGIVGYVDAIQTGKIKDIVNSWCYNTPRDITYQLKEKKDEISVAKSIEQGDYLTDYLLKSNNDLEKDILNSLFPIDLFGLKITILSPDANTIKRLRKKYSKQANAVLDYDELTSVSEAKAAEGDDYEILAGDFNSMSWREDKSLENRSSIAVLIEFNGKNSLWLADSHPSLVSKALRKLGFSKKNPLSCEWVKVAHHGSKGNNSDELYSMIKCENYIISANGENQHFLPAKESLVRILQNSNRPVGSFYNFHFTYDNSTLRSIFNIDGLEIFESLNFNVSYQNSEVFVISS